MILKYVVSTGTEGRTEERGSEYAEHKTLCCPFGERSEEKTPGSGG